MSKNKKAVRNAFRTAVFERDGHKCKFCERTDQLDAHHITDRNILPNGGYVLENGITVCPYHHELVEKHHQNLPLHEQYRPPNLYRLIGATYAKAYSASLDLESH